jgi:DNA excision repair protein ERCC-2
VRQLVETVLMRGDIDLRHKSKSSAAEGSKAHRTLQKKYSASDRSEVTVKKDIIVGDFLLTVQGRIDGVLNFDTEPVIEEIKSTYRDIEAFSEPDELHLAQTKVYGSFYASLHDLHEIGVQVTYYSLSEKKSKVFFQTYDANGLHCFVEELCRRYSVFLSLRSELNENRDISIKKLPFPYPYREYQRSVIKKIYKTISERKNIFINAPTGTGKTINALFPAIKSLPQTSCRLFYLSSKSTQKQIAEDTLELMRQNGLSLTSVTLTAKEKICFLDTPSCNPDDCEYAKGYYDKLNNVLTQELKQRQYFDADTIRAIAQENGMCPFELSLDLSAWADAVICDYNYVFDPFAYLKRNFDEPENNGNYIFLIDEAHNLLDRSRDMYSAQLDKKEILRVKRLVKDEAKLSKALRALNSTLLQYQKGCGESDVCMLEMPDESLFGNLYAFLGTADKYLTIHTASGGEAYDAVRELYRAVYRFLVLLEESTDSHRLYYEKSSSLLKLFCCNAKDFLHARLEQGKSAVFFSATLHPLPYYCELLGGNATDYLLNVPSIFDQNHFKIAIDRSVKTNYRERNDYYLPIAKKIKKITELVPGNHLVFFPSYDFMQRVLERYTELSPQLSPIVQNRSMREEDRLNFLNNFTEQSLHLGFTVSGGIFSEGIDLVGDRLNGVIICGVPLPQICTERELIRTYFEANGTSGFDYAYLYPAMNKVLQAMGRVIRTQTDEGFAVLLDERFSLAPYKACMPPQYKDFCITRSTDETIRKLS